MLKKTLKTDKMEKCKVLWLILSFVGITHVAIAYSESALFQKIPFPFAIRAMVLNSQGSTMFLLSDEGHVFQLLLSDDQGIAESATYCDVEIGWENELSPIDLDFLGWSEGMLSGYSRKADQPLFAIIPAACDSLNLVALQRRIPMAMASPINLNLSCVQETAFSNLLKRSFVLTCQGELHAAEKIRSFQAHQEEPVLGPALPGLWFYFLPALRLSYEKDGSQVVRQTGSFSLDDSLYSNSQITIWMEWSLDGV